MQWCAAWAAEWHWRVAVARAERALTNDLPLEDVEALTTLARYAFPAAARARETLPDLTARECA